MTRILTVTLDAADALTVGHVLAGLDHAEYRAEVSAAVHRVCAQLLAAAKVEHVPAEGLTARSAKT